jgi:uncharacterized protein (TIGR03790 family)
MPFRMLVASLAMLVLPLAARNAAAQTGANVLVIANAAVPASVQIAERYVARRGVPPDQVLQITPGTNDQIARADFERLIQKPIVDWLAAHQAQDRILYIVLTKGIPLRIAGTAGRNGTMGSVDSELTLLYRRMAGVFAGPNGSIENPYFLGSAPVAGAARFSHAKHDIYLVTRLDGFTVDDALGLVERGASPSSSGKILLDQRAGLDDVPNKWLAAAAEALEAQGFGDRVLLDRTSHVIDHETDVLGYYSWGSNDRAHTSRQLDLQFVPGAIAGMFLSSDARTFTEPPAAWKPGAFQGAPMNFAGSAQSLTGDLIRAGVTGVSGQVAEPYLDKSIRPDILFPAYLAGFNLAEAFYMAMPDLSWQTVVIGDPLCQPFDRAAIPETELNPPIVPETELPARFSERRVESMALKTTDPRTVLDVLQAQSREARGDLQGARESYERAAALDDSLNDVWRLLASVYEKLDEHDKADAVYRKLLEREPNDTVALNNLAYSLAVRHNNPKEALPLAERADILSPRNAVIYDTLGYIKHLMGDHADGARMLALAAQAMPDNTDVQLHAAAALAAAGRLDEAAKRLQAAKAIDPKVAERPEYRETEQKLRK